MRGLIGKKIGMTQIYNKVGEIIPITIVEAGPCVVTQVKTFENDGYNSVQVGYSECKEKHTKQPLKGHFNKAGVKPQRVIAEFDCFSGFKYKPGQEFTVTLFREGELVSVTGRSKGRGFAGVIKRHNYHQQPATHGQSEYLRHPGSIGQASYPARVFKGMGMPGHYGNKRITVQSLEVVKIDKEKNQLFLKGAIPGAKNGIIYITK